MPIGRVLSASIANGATSSSNKTFATTITSVVVNTLQKVSSSALATSTVPILPHPILFTVAPKRYYGQILLQLQQQQQRSSSSSSLVLDRYKSNGSKLYTRYILTLLALQLATEQSIARLEQRTKHPKEWDRGVDVLRELEEQEIATYRAGLGKTAAARVFNAGMSYFFKNKKEVSLQLNSIVTISFWVFMDHMEEALCWEKTPLV